MSESYLYGGVPANAESAAGVKGILLRTLGGTMVFRVYRKRHDFTDYEIRHDDLSVTIDADAFAAFYKVGDRDILDYHPEMLCLRKILE